MMMIQRRTLLSQALAGAATVAAPALVRAQAASAHVVIVGGGFGGATAARYLRRYAPDLRITLVEPEQRFYTCPFSNLYLAGLRTWESIGHGFDELRAAGIHIIHARADDVDASASRRGRRTASSARCFASSVAMCRRRPAWPHRRCGASASTSASCSATASRRSR